jgi:sterol 14-demethylase
VASETAEGQAFRPIPFVSGPKAGTGHLDEFTNTPLEFLHRAYDECGEICEFDAGGLRTVLLVGPEAHEAFFRAPEEQLNAAGAYQMMVPVFGEGVQYGATHEIERQQLRIQYQGLRYERMANYASVVASEVEEFIAGWGDEGEMDIYEAFTDLTLKTSTHCLLGTDFRRRLTSEFAHLYHDLERGLDPSALLDPHQQKDTFTARDIARVRLQELITGAIRERRNKPGDYHDMLQIYMDARYEDGSPLSDHEITGMVIWFMFAGHHTSSNTSAWTLLEIARHPQYQPALKAEIDALWGREKELSFHALREIPLLEGFVREVLRIHPPLNAISRRVLYDWVYKDYKVTAGKNVMVCPHVSHKLPEYFPDPETFDPRRPNPENVFASIPFGGGKHKCIGNAFALLQVKSIFCALLHRYDFELVQPPDYYKEIMPSLILRPSEPCPLRYKRRTDLPVQKKAA